MGTPQTSEPEIITNLPQPRAIAGVTLWRIVAGVLLVAFLATIGLLAHQENGGPPHVDTALPGNLPATLYLPPGFIMPVTPLAPAERPAGVVLLHGYAADRQGTSELARRLAQNGYIVLAIDGHGHGANRNPFTDFGAPGKGSMDGDIDEAVGIMRTLTLADPARIVAVGHSMGAGAALDYAQADDQLAGSVMVSGGRGLWGAHHPRNALMIFAEHDNELTKSASAKVAATLAGVPEAELGKIYGDPAKGTAVEAIEVPRVNHGGILHSVVAARDIIMWLDTVTGTRRSGPLALQDPRRKTTGLAILLFVALLVPLGRVCGSIVPEWKRAAGGGWTGLLIVALVLVVATPLIEVATPLSFLSLVGGAEFFSWLGVAGVLLLAMLVWREAIDWHRISAGLGPTILAAAIALGLIYAAAQPMMVTVHRIAFTPERLVAAFFATCATLPFFLGFELLVRRGGLAISTTLAAVGRVMLMVMLFGGINADLLPIGFGPAYVLIFANLFVMFEIFAASVYSVSSNIALIALVESAWLAWIISCWMPITIFI